MWVMMRTINSNKTAPGMTVTLARVIIDCTMKTRSRIEAGSQIAARFEGFEEEEYHQAG